MTQTAQHTPGPWTYNRDEGGYQGHVISTGDYIICDLPDAGDGAAPQTEANAQLIAAAPDILDALECMTEAAQAVIDSWSSGDLARAVNGLEASIDAARTTIEQATTP